jgi:PadR family transcriptional regulator, regulatory protein PadR
MNTENAKAQMRKGILEMCILGIIRNDEVYPSDIIEKLKEVELIIVEGTLYPLLTRLKNAGMLDYQWKESTTGPPRKYYRITQEGEAFLNELTSNWQRLVNAVTESLKNNPSDE